MDSRSLLAELVALPGPPGQEGHVRDAVASHVGRLGLSHRIDAKGNLLVPLGSGKPRIVVTAHLDEVAMMVKAVQPDGGLTVVPMGGLYPWKIGEGLVQILASGGAIDGVLSFGSIHTNDPESTVRRAERDGLGWSEVRVQTMRTCDELRAIGVRPGTRVVVHPKRRILSDIGDHVTGNFLDDRAELVACQIASVSLKDKGDLLFAATVSEEVGGHGALYLAGELRPDIIIALEIGPNVSDAPVELSARPTVWASDSCAAMLPADCDLIAGLAAVQFQVLSRGGSDASCAAALGLCARPITLGVPVANSHGAEVMHRDAMTELATLVQLLVQELLSTG